MRTWVYAVDAATRTVHIGLSVPHTETRWSPLQSLAGIDVGFSIGIAQGYATLGRIGFEGRYEYSAVGSGANLGARLCSAAQPWQIVISQRLVPEVERIADLESLGELTLKGFHRPVAAHNIVRLRT
ncbi:MAG: hypothetical protein FJX64_07660 [Alphaproteobacteria bacterium]|nr:hypothetical protein [Alphaproteobacteria bacterium]